MSQRSRGSRAQRRALALLSAGVVATGALTGLPSATAADTPSTLTSADPALAKNFQAGRYIVLMRADSATRYDGGTPGFSATKAAPGEHFNAHSANVRKYARHLEGRQDALAGSVGADVSKHYTLASNGFTADLSGKQAQALSTDKRVLMVTEDTAYSTDTWNTPGFLGLDGANGQWAQHGGGPANAGAGIVIADLDTGIWPESASFAGDALGSAPSGKYGMYRTGNDIYMTKADGTTFHGFCQPGEQWSADDCSSKLVGARYYPDAFLNSVPPEHRAATEFISTRDGGGHGSHTASTAAGNHGVDVTVDGTHFGAVSGMAPAAKIAAYKVCFEDDDPDTGGCYGSSTLQAVDDAITDNVDVLNYSISGATNTVVDAVEYAFEGAAEAGIFVSASAGNAGPGVSTVAHNSPWLTTVGASTHHSFENTLVLGDGTKIKGASIASAPLSSHPLVSSVVAKASGATEADANLCLPGTLDAAKVTGKIVACTRGVNARVEKSQTVADAGGVGMVLMNAGPSSLDADLHVVPSVHITHLDAPKVQSYMATQGDAATAEIVLGDQTGGAPTPIPVMAPFSSRGPALANDSDVIKPDITAPGVSVLAAVAPPSNSGRDYDLYSGTSMSSPHVAGLAAFMLGVHPDWTPMMIKSAMMTTAYDVKDDSGKTVADPFAEGAGHVDPTKFFNPGLVVTSDAAQWRGFLQGQGLDLGVKALKASDLNGPSIAQGQVVGTTTLGRTFTGLVKGQWRVKASVPGFTVVPSRDALAIGKAGQSKRVDFTFTRTTAPLKQWATGFVTLTGPTTVRLPVALRPVSVKAPARADGTGQSGSVRVPLTAGFTGDLAVSSVGLAKGLSDTSTVAQGAAKAYVVTVAPGSKLLRVDLDAADNAADMDLYVYRFNAAGNALEALAGQSATGSADESVSLSNPVARKYYVYIDGYAAAPGASSIDYRVDVFNVDGTSTAGNLAATPNPVPVTAGVQSGFDATWSGLDPASRYLGWFEYDGALSPTYLYVNS